MESVIEFLKVNTGDGSGSGSGSGSGYGDGYGSGSGDGSGDGVKSLNSQKVYLVDRVQTIIDILHGSVAKGKILKSDLTIEPCFVVKGQNMFAHGKTLKQAVADLQTKIFSNLNVDEKIKNFHQKFKADKWYVAQEFYDWHGMLTGSCTQGRDVFARQRGIKMTDTMTVAEFITTCKNQFGWEVIKRLSE